jgi:pimeloyl-ACP methyl ester carboxylesterase
VASVKIKEFSIIIAFSFVLVACDQGLTTVAERALYPSQTVNERHPVPASAPLGVESMSVQGTTAHGDNIRVHGWFYQNPQPTKVSVLYFHGNGENIRSIYEYGLVDRIAKLGANVLIFDYPSWGLSEGVPNEASLVLSGELALNWLSQRAPDNAIIVLARSLGAGVAPQVAVKYQEQINSLILISAWSRFLDLAKHHTSLARQLPKEWVSKHNYDSVRALKHFTKPVRLLHGDQDSLIPIKLGKKVFAALPKIQEQMFITLTGREHNDVYLDPRLWQALTSLIQKH